MEARRRILVVEDDPETAGQILESLTANGYQVDVAVNGNDALSRGRSGSYVVLTIDRMLPDLDGIAVMQQLREDGMATPVLIVSALGEIDDRVRGLRAGGDDYLVKPFAFAELVARVDALARRSAIVVRETVLRVGDLEVDLVSRRSAGTGAKSRSFPANSSFSNIWSATKAGSCRVPCFCSMDGIFISIRHPTSLMSMSGECAAR
jgi:two-component system OmpR family response regulator